jgi:large subunit ribosomal protein L24
LVLAIGIAQKVGVGWAAVRRLVAMKSKLKRSDEVMVVNGREKGKHGKVLSIDHSRSRIIIEGLNMVKKTMRKSQKNQKGGIVEIEAPIHLSNVMIVCRKCGPTRIGYKIEKGAKNRVCRKCGEQL